MANSSSGPGSEFLSEDDLTTYEAYLQYQGLDPATLTEDEAAFWRGEFDESVRRAAAAPKVGRMSLRRPGRRPYAVAERDADGNLWLVLWIQVHDSGDLYILRPSADPERSTHARC